MSEATMQNIMDILLAAGYFRARLPTLKPFDKLLGAMAWCITLSNEDISLEFSDEMNMGKKLKLAEIVVNSLRTMGCPHQLQPHQIQGLNYTQIFPVIQWLVKQVLAHQQSYSKQTELQASLHYSSISNEVGYSKIKDLLGLHKPKRQYKTQSAKKFDDPIRVYSALLEYGDITASAGYENYLRSHAEAGSSLKQVESEALFEGNEGDAHPLLEANRVDIRNTAVVSGANVAKYIGSEDLQKARNSYLESRKQDESEVMQQRLEKERIDNLISSLRKQINIKRDEKETLESSLVSLKRQLEPIQEEFEKLKETNERLIASIANLEENALHSKGSLTNEMIETIELLVSQRNQLKEEERRFKEECNQEIARLESQKEEVLEGEAKEWLDKIDRGYNDTLKKYEKTKEILAEKNRQVAALQRRLENTPSQTELIQYQRRFVELYDSINFKLEENRKLFSNYNSLLEMRNLLQSEIDMLNSFQDGMQDIKKKKLREEFMRNMQAAVDQVSNKAKLAAGKSNTLKQELREFENRMKGIQDEERLYYKLIKEIQDFMN